MISERHEQLIHEILEGDASPAQRAELERLIAADPEIRARHDEMSSVFRLLAEAPDPGVPDDLHAGIVRAIAAEPPHGVPESRATGLRRGSRWPVLGAFLAGAATASLLVVAALRGPYTGRPGTGDLASGTLAPLEPARGRLVSNNSFTARDGRIEWVVRRSGSSVEIDVRVQGDRAVDLGFDYPADSLDLIGLQWSGPPLGTGSMGVGRLTVGGVRPGSLVIKFTSRGPADALIHTRVGGQAGATLHTGPLGEGG